MRISDWSSDVCSSDLFEEMAVDVDRMAHHGVIDKVHAHPLALNERDGFMHVGHLLAVERPHETFHVARQMNVDAARGRPHIGVAVQRHEIAVGDRKSTRLNSSHYCASRLPSSA